jgi:hypothetical protein
MCDVGRERCFLTSLLTDWLRNQVGGFNIEFRRTNASWAGWSAHVDDLPILWLKLKLKWKWWTEKKQMCSTATLIHRNSDQRRSAVSPSRPQEPGPHSCPVQLCTRSLNVKPNQQLIDFKISSSKIHVCHRR